MAKATTGPTVTNFASQTVGTTERDLPANGTSLTYNTADVEVQFFVSCQNMAAGDEFLFQVYEKVDGSTAEAIWSTDRIGAQPGPIITPFFSLGNGWTITAKKIAGTDRVFTGGYRYIDSSATVDANVVQWRGSTPAVLGGDGTQVSAIAPMADGSLNPGPWFVKLSESTAARRRIYFEVLNKVTGARVTGATGGLNVNISKNGASGAGATNTAVEVDATLLPGVYYIELTAAEVNTLGVYRLYITSTGMTQDATVNVVNWDPYDAVRSGMTALPNAAAEAAGGLYTRGSGAGQINQNANGQVDARIVAWLSTALDSVFNYVVENSKTFVQYIRIAKSALAGKAAGFDTGSRTYRDDADTKARITATVDATGRTAVTVDGT